MREGGGMGVVDQPTRPEMAGHFKTPGGGFGIFEDFGGGRMRNRGAVASQDGYVSPRRMVIADAADEAGEARHRRGRMGSAAALSLVR